jgi:polycomb complex protein BMI-1-B
LSIEYLPQDISSYFYIPLIKSTTKLGPNGYPLNGCDDHNQRRYLSCEGAMKVYHLKKWLQLKYDLKANHEIEILYKQDPLPDDYTMMDLAYIYSWRRNGHLSLYYKIIDKKSLMKKRKQQAVAPAKEVEKPYENQANKNDVTVSRTIKKTRRLSKVIEKLTRKGAKSDICNVTENQSYPSFLYQTSDWSDLNKPLIEDKSNELFAKNLNETKDKPVNE